MRPGRKRGRQAPGGPGPARREKRQDEAERLGRRALQVLSQTPPGEQGSESNVSPGTVFFAQDEADVAGAIGVLTFRLDNRVDADAVVGQ